MKVILLNDLTTLIFDRLKKKVGFNKLLKSNDDLFIIFCLVIGPAGISFSGLPTAIRTVLDFSSQDLSDLKTSVVLTSIPEGTKITSLADTLVAHMLELARHVELRRFKDPSTLKMGSCTQTQLQEFNELINVLISRVGES